MAFTTLPTIEVSFYFLVWTASVIYAMYTLAHYRSRFDNFEDSYQDFSEGWLILNRKKDAADLEWQSFLYCLNDVYPWILVSLVITEYLRRNSYSKVLDCWQVLLTVLFITHKIGVTFLLIFFMQPILFEFISRLRSKTALWCFNILCLLFFNLNLKMPGPILGIFVTSELNHYFIITSAAWINLRCLSFYIDNANKVQVRNVFYYIHVLAYMLYLPTLFLGPFLFYSDFQNGRNYKDMLPLRKRLIKLVCNLLRYGFWLLFTEFILHFLYVNVYVYDIRLISTFSSWTLYGYGYSMGQFFHLKYVVMYGLSTSIAQFEEVTVPDTPKCIGRIHLYSDMWKYFDQNLHNFLVRYIYVPTLKRRNLQNKIFSSLLSFSFVFAWHGIEHFIFLWTFLNFFGITLESLCKCFYANYLVDWKVFNTLSQQWQMRIICFLTSPLLAMSAVSNFYFFAGDAIGGLFIHRFFNDPWSTNVFVLFILYSCCVVSTELKHWDQSKLKKL